MASKVGVISILAVIAMAMFVPMVDADDDGTALFSYISQLDENGRAVYFAVDKATSVTDGTLTFSIDFVNNMYDEKYLAEAYADATVQNALAAVYYADPMVPYLWDYPAIPVEVISNIGMGTWTEEGVSISKYFVKSVSFSLTVPEGITQESMDELKEAIASLNMARPTEKETILAIMTYLDNIAFAEDTETHVSNIYDALVKKASSSAGIAAAFVELCSKNDIRAITVSGINHTATTEEKSFWNYVELLGQFKDKSVGYAWYIVDAAYCASIGIAGYQTNLDLDGTTYSMMSTHITDMGLSSPNSLTVPLLNPDAYVPPEGLSFMDLYGSKILSAIVMIVIAIALIMVLRERNN